MERHLNSAPENLSAKTETSEMNAEELQSSPWRNPELEQAMEEIYHPPSTGFSLADFHDGKENVERNHKYDENDYQLHRMESFHHHQPLRRLHHHRHRAYSRSDQEETEFDDDTKVDEKSDEVNIDIKVKTDEPVLPVKVREAEPMKNRENEKVQFFLGSVTSLEHQSDDVKNSPAFLPGRKLSAPSVISLRSSLKKPTSKDGKKDPKGVSFTDDSNLLEENEGESAFYIGESSVTEPLLCTSRDCNANVNANTNQSKVTFQLGEENVKEIKELDEDSNQKSLSKKGDHHHHHHHHRKHRHRHEPHLQRLQSGSSLDHDRFSSHQIIEPEEAAMLQTADLDDLASHRFENQRGIRRHKIQAKSSVSSFIHLSRKEGVDVKSLPFVKKLYDHQPHEIFVELDELVQGPSHQDLEWRETARWIKYEENVEEGAERWGKPHVASLSFHSLLSLRKCLEQGTVLLDLEEKDLPGIAQKVVENMVATNQLMPENQGAVLRALLLRHRHVNDRNLMFGMRRNSSVYSNLNQLVSNDKSKSPKIISMGRRASSYSPQEMVDKNIGKNNQGTIKTVSSDTKLQPELEVLVNHTKSQDDLQKMDVSILKRIPEGAEATTVLVGALDTLQQPIIAFIRLAKGQMMPNLIEVPIPVRFIFVLLGPIRTELDYHEIGRSISTLMANHNFHEVAYKADDRKDLLCAINEFLDDSIVLPPGDWERKSLLPIQEIRKKYQEIRQRKRKEEKEKEPSKYPSYDPLQRSRRCFGGVINDIKHRFPWYLSDIKDGLNGQCLAAAIFIYFAALSGAITFGGLMGDKTDNLIGVSETLVITAACGILYSLLSGQPMVIIGTTGPVLLFDEILFKFCNDNDIEFLPMRVWISFWVAIIATLVVALEGSSLVRFFSRFTQEIFAALISLLYIYESFNKLYQVFLQHPLLADYCNTSNISKFNESATNYTDISQNLTLRNFNASISKTANLTKTSIPEMINQPNTALLSTIMMIGTFFIAHFLRHFRNSKFLGRNARRALGDFGVPIAIIIMVGLDASFKDSYTQKLSVPEGLSPSDPSQRGWLISPIGMQRPIAVWHAFAALIAAVLIFILLFLEIQICELIINKKERKLRKGSGFHLDLILISYMEIGCAVLGGPWMCAATVRSVSHVASLTVMSRTHAPGELPYVIEVKEQRVTNFLVSFLIGVSVLMAPLLRKVPVSVLFGVFLYMGISSMSGIQLFDRLQLLFMPVKHHPESPYVQKVPTVKMHLYTLIQLLSLAVLWAVKSTAAALAFPFVLLLMVPIRSQLKCCFTLKELHALDGEEIDDEHEEPDFYQQILP